MDADSTVRAVAFDYKAVLSAPGHAHDGIAELLRWLDERDVAWVLLTNEPMDAEAALSSAGLPAPTLHLSRDDIPGKAKRGNGAWLETVADRLRLRMNQLILVGTSQFDWYTGIHAGVVHVHARWASRLGKPITSLTSDEPADVIELLEHFLLHEPSWAFRLNDEDRDFAIRSLLPFNAQFPRGGGRTFTIKDIFTYDKTVKVVGSQDARDVLMLRLLCAAYLDGALPGQSYFCVYPSSTPAKGSPQLAGFLERAKVMTGSSYKEDLLERVAQAPDTSLERYKRSIGQSSTKDISIAAQARTVRINPNYRKKIAGKTVIVFDDFTTEGKSIEWARILLGEAGAARVIALTIGKYPSPPHRLPAAPRCHDRPLHHQRRHGSRLPDDQRARGSGRRAVALTDGGHGPLRGLCGRRTYRCRQQSGADHRVCRGDGNASDTPPGSRRHALGHELRQERAATAPCRHTRRAPEPGMAELARRVPAPCRRDHHYGPVVDLSAPAGQACLSVVRNAGRRDARQRPLQGSGDRLGAGAAPGGAAELAQAQDRMEQRRRRQREALQPKGMPLRDGPDSA